jgi:hypothetical protein
MTLGHHPVSISCDEEEEGVSVVANVGDGHKLKVVINGSEEMNEAVDGAVMDRTFFFAWTDWPATVTVATLFANGEPEGEPMTNEDLDCAPEGEPSVDLDKFVWDEGGLVTHVEEGSAVTYTYEVTNDGETNLDIALIEDLIVSSPGADPGDTACDDFDRQLDNPGNDDDVFEPGETWVFTCTVDDPTLPVGQTDNEACVYANVAAPLLDAAPVMQVDPHESDVYSCAEYSITVTEGDTGGGEGTPAGGSIPDTATSLSSQSNPLATLIFGLAMISALGGLAFVNVRASNRR